METEKTNTHAGLSTAQELLAQAREKLRNMNLADAPSVAQLKTTVESEVSRLDDELADKAAINHNHDECYAGIAHNHECVYSELNHQHGNYATLEHTHEQYAATDHNHDDRYPTSQEVACLINGVALDIACDYEGSALSCAVGTQILEAIDQGRHEHGCSYDYFSDDALIKKSDLEQRLCGIEAGGGGGIAETDHLTEASTIGCGCQYQLKIEEYSFTSAYYHTFATSDQDEFCNYMGSVSGELTYGLRDTYSGCFYTTSDVWLPCTYNDPEPILATRGWVREVMGGGGSSGGSGGSAGGYNECNHSVEIGDTGGCCGVYASYGSVAIGCGAQARSYDGVAIGDNAYSGGCSYSVAIGAYADASEESIAIGEWNISSAGSIVIGSCSCANGIYSIAIGKEAYDYGAGSVVIGWGAGSSFGMSVAIGEGASAEAEDSVVIGAYDSNNVESSVQLGGQGGFIRVVKDKKADPYGSDPINTLFDFGDGAHALRISYANLKTLLLANGATEVSAF